MVGYEYVKDALRKDTVIALDFKNYTTSALEWEILFIPKTKSLAVFVVE